MPYTPVGWEDVPSEKTPIDADNLNHMDEQIKANADALVPASTENIGLVKPDGETITVDEDGTIHGSAGGASTWSEVAEKPFESIGSNLEVVDGVLNATPMIKDFEVEGTRYIDLELAKGSNTNLLRLDEQGGVFNFYTNNSGTTWNGGQVATQNIISDAYNPSRNYSAGEFCIYNNTLWKSKVANNLGNTPSEGSYWTGTNVGNEINNSKWKKQGEYTPSQEFTLPTTGEIMLIAEVPNRWNQAILYTIAERIPYTPMMLLSLTPGVVICLIDMVNGKYKMTRAELSGTNYINDPNTKIVVYYR